MQCPTNASARPSTILTNTTVSTWVSDTSQAGYSYHADITHPDITVDMPASVIYSPTDASSGNYAPICQTGTGYVRIFSKVNTTITIPTIKIEGAINYYELQGTVGSDTKPIKIVNGQAVAVANNLVSTSGDQTINGWLTLGNNNNGGYLNIGPFGSLYENHSDSVTYMLLTSKNITSGWYGRLVLSSINDSNHTTTLSLQKLNAQGGWVTETVIASI